MSIYSTIIHGKTPYLKTARLDIEFAGTADDPAMIVVISIDGEVMLMRPLTIETYTFEYDFQDNKDVEEHEFKIEVRGKPTGAMLHLQRISIEGLDMRLTMEDSGECYLDGVQSVPSEYMGQVGYQSLKFTTPIYPWLLANQRKDSYYYHH